MEKYYKFLEKLLVHAVAMKYNGKMKGNLHMENFGDDKQVYIRKLSEEDYSTYREVSYTHFSYKNVFTEKFMQTIWKEVNAASVLPVLSLRKAQARLVDSVILKILIHLHQKSALICEMTIWAENMPKKL